MVASMFVVGIPFLTGWQIAITRKGIRGDQTLPDWSDWGEYWSLGWRALVVGLVYAIPIFLTIAVLFIPAIVVLIIAGESQADELLIAGIVPMLLGALVLTIYSVLLYFMQPAYMAAIAVSGNIADAFAMRRFILPYVKANIVPVIIAWAIAYLVGMISSIGLLFFFVGYFFTYPYAVAAIAYTYGVIYRNSPVKLQPKPTLNQHV